ncbi:hypothetical protein OQJ46_14905 [Microbulbifer thermotolerans]|uniref:Immunity MXAN-0049 protein domain-containing protein n=1 Tax=Microbulbifer thermotolerans TaxID=252514 RepID=A0AB35HW05_MICTH|nr:DUF1629 domain-containing protein [Microbulbifer thermotolerans]MCX2780865.1 hypothetical protein [Microbulbifer thermotolerans]MCX2784281.1 hypothetical protein [Microbulbifer thermotolerans]MCX2801006.1 hypothetical protein [Microbulbifer thermotolerans]MCX2804830.1 hypothetical protein [Microbulbifer thermotolerans]MCX2831565.1 hypothetical protein [Microbulbifer thermotolerans]
MKAYIIQPKYDEYKSYLVKNEELSREHYSSTRCKGQALDWPEPLEIIADEEDSGIPEADIGLLSVGSLVFTEGVYIELRNEALKYGQLLPLKYGKRTLWLWNVTNVCNALNIEKSELNSFGGVTKPVLNASTVNENMVFKLREDNYTGIYCNDTFRNLVEHNKFSGIEFEELDVDHG